MRVGHILVCHSIDPFRLFESVPVTDDNRWYVFFHGTDRNLSNRIQEIVTSRHGRFFPYFENRGLSRSWNEGLYCAQDDKCDLFMIVNDDMFFYDGGHSKFVTLAKAKMAQDASLGFVYATGLEGPQSPLAGQVISQGLACSVLTPAVVGTIGYFDELFWPAYWEDMDYTRRAALAGISYHISEECLVEHDRGSTMRTSPGVMGDSNSHFAANQRRFLEKWGDGNAYDHPYNDPTATTFLGKKKQ